MRDLVAQCIDGEGDNVSSSAALALATTSPAMPISAR
jgi:hypothetical protein